jgi:hypothetical protein
MGFSGLQAFIFLRMVSTAQYVSPLSQAPACTVFCGILVNNSFTVAVFSRVHELMLILILSY